MDFHLEIINTGLDGWLRSELQISHKKQASVELGLAPGRWNYDYLRRLNDGERPSAKHLTPVHVALAISRYLMGEKEHGLTGDYAPLGCHENGTLRLPADAAAAFALCRQFTADEEDEDKVVRTVDPRDARQVVDAYLEKRREEDVNSDLADRALFFEGRMVRVAYEVGGAGDTDPRLVEHLDVPAPGMLAGADAIFLRLTKGMRKNASKRKLRAVLFCSGLSPALRRPPRRAKLDGRANQALTGHFGSVMREIRRYTEAAENPELGLRGEVSVVTYKFANDSELQVAVVPLAHWMCNPGVVSRQAVQSLEPELEFPVARFEGELLKRKSSVVETNPRTGKAEERALKYEDLTELVQLMGHKAAGLSVLWGPTAVGKTDSWDYALSKKVHKDVDGDQPGLSERLGARELLALLPRELPKEREDWLPHPAVVERAVASSRLIQGKLVDSENAWAQSAALWVNTASPLQPVVLIDDVDVVAQWFASFVEDEHDLEQLVNDSFRMVSEAALFMAAAGNHVCLARRQELDELSVEGDLGPDQVALGAPVTVREIARGPVRLLERVADWPDARDANMSDLSFFTDSGAFYTQLWAMERMDRQQALAYVKHIVGGQWPDEYRAAVEDLIGRYAPRYLPARFEHALLDHRLLPLALQSLAKRLAASTPGKGTEQGAEHRMDLVALNRLVRQAIIDASGLFGFGSGSFQEDSMVVLEAEPVEEMVRLALPRIRRLEPGPGQSESDPHGWVGKLAVADVLRASAAYALYADRGRGDATIGRQLWLLELRGVITDREREQGMPAPIAELHPRSLSEPDRELLTACHLLRCVDGSVDELAQGALVGPSHDAWLHLSRTRAWLLARTWGALPAEKREPGASGGAPSLVSQAALARRIFQVAGRLVQRSAGRVGSNAELASLLAGLQLRFERWVPLEEEDELGLGLPSRLPEVPLDLRGNQVAKSGQEWNWCGPSLLLASEDEQELKIRRFQVSGSGSDTGLELKVSGEHPVILHRCEFGGEEVGRFLVLRLRLEENAKLVLEHCEFRNIVVQIDGRASGEVVLRGGKFDARFEYVGKERPVVRCDSERSASVEFGPRTLKAVAELQELCPVHDRRTALLSPKMKTFAQGLAPEALQDRTAYTVRASEVGDVRDELYEFGLDLRPIKTDRLELVRMW